MNLDHNEIHQVCVCLTSAWRKFRLLQESKVMDIVQCIKLSQFSLIHYLQKVLSLHLYFTTLVNWAHSPRLRASLCMQLHVQTLASATEAPKLPTTSAGWTAALNDLLSTGEVEANGDSFIQKSVNGVHSRARHERRCPIHCEVSLVEYFHKHSSPAYTYIGVSKLSCLACHLFLENFRKYTGKRFQTKRDP